MLPVFPNVGLMTWDLPVRPTWGTLSMKTASGVSFRTSLSPYAVTEFDLAYSYLDLADKEQLRGFFNSQNGSLGSFYFDKQNDDAVSIPFGFGVGDGATTKFTLLKPAGTGAIEPIGSVIGPFGLAAPDNVIYDNGVALTPSTDYSWDGTNVITFVAAPAAGHALTWTGSYYYLVHFKDNKLEFNELADQMFEVKKLTLEVVW